MAPMVVPDVLPDFKSWLQNNAVVNAYCGNRVYFRIPPKTAFPLMRLYLVSMVPTSIYEPSFTARLGLHLWGNANNMYQALRELSIALQSEFWQLEAGLLVPGGQTYVYSAQMATMQDSPDPETGNPRFIGTANVFCRMTGADDLLVS